ncbi:hypothetical protein HM1_2736 [Heliomicrobium modesticaldum Ice1]|uniref:Uncharacterized protein n=1 Tax=Heliobacterium modesticaldum (strain ATCC 51547 / Ice1) TaxID=498761 RepID=B0TBZ2_HELMI|nr:hypothetical protein [Heliomicrobium modesticaldum]ABZ85265.1 hypothetical protein HM1_2736 [Heliomicrobium modesticaldum Ice1]
MKTVGIAGTAKNTGKTTTASALLREAYRRRRRVAVTSIGYDGEELDNITGLPKPRLALEPGTLVATARKCLPPSTAHIRILEDTNIPSALGAIIIGEVLSPGLVVVAGPNKAAEVGQVKGRLACYRPDLLMVDGALNRIAPMVETDGVILATGAARHADPGRLTDETESIAQIFRLPQGSTAVFADGGGVACRYKGQWRKMPLADAQMLTVDDGRDLGRQILAFLASGTVDETDEGLLALPRLVTTTAMRSLLSTAGPRLKGWRIFFCDPVTLLLSGNPGETDLMLRQLRESGLMPLLRRSIPLLAVTVNPFYPAYDAESQTYQPRYLPGGVLEGRLGRRLKVPVLDVKRKGALALWRKALGF